MKKFLVLITVLAMASIGSDALAADVSLSGFVGVRARNFDNTTDFNKDNNDKQVDTQEKLRLEVNVKASDDLKGKVSIENYWDTWGRFEAYQANDGDTTAPGATNPANSGQNTFLRVREAWISFNVPGVPVNVTTGHQLLQLGNGWFFRSKYFGSDAWVVANVTGNNTIAFVDVKAFEGASNSNDDIDAYVLLDVLKLNEDMTAGINITYANDRRNGLGLGGASTRETQAQNIGLTFDGKIGPVNLNAEADVQMGKAKGNDAKLKGNQIVIQGNVPVDPVTVKFTVARGSGAKVGDSDIKQMVTLLDIDTHYTYLYEYKTRTACGALNTGFCNTTAISAGVSADVAKSLNVGLDVWYLMATEKKGTPLAFATNGASTSSDVGTEIDAHVNWKLYDNLSWNWNLGYFKPGDAMKTGATPALADAAPTDAATGIQGYLIFKF